jgi:hypothetical protein
MNRKNYNINYHCCIFVILFESHQEIEWQLVWQSDYQLLNCLNKYGLDDEWELANRDIIHNHPHRFKEDKVAAWNEYLSFTQDRAVKVENNYPDKSKTKDWSAPGTNY